MFSFSKMPFLIQFSLVFLEIVTPNNRIFQRLIHLTPFLCLLSSIEYRSHKIFTLFTVLQIEIIRGGEV